MWTKKDLIKTGLKHNLDEDQTKNPVFTKKIQPKSKISVEKNTITTMLWVMKKEGTIENYVEELVFDSIRRFRFDWAIPDLKIAIEYEGIFSKKSRHTTISGYTEDCEKYNLAIANGWKVLRYTAKNYTNLEKDLKKILKLQHIVLFLMTKYVL